MTDNNTTEQKLVDIEITQNGAYSNISPNKQLNDGEYIIVEKGQYPDAMEKQGKFGPYGVASCIYKDTNVSFFINGENNIKRWNESGDAGAKVRVSAKATGKFSSADGRATVYINFAKEE